MNMLPSSGSTNKLQNVYSMDGSSFFTSIKTAKLQVIMEHVKSDVNMCV